jgi:putative membrane protein (TIGR04086 family)
MRTTIKQRLRYEKIAAIFTAVTAFFFVLFLCSAVFSAVVNALEMGSAARVVLSSIAICAGCFAGAYTLAKRRRHGGIATGLLTGAAVFAAVFLGSLFLGGAFTAGGFFTKLFIIFICSLIGGIAGVNKKV